LTRNERDLGHYAESDPVFFLACVVVAGCYGAATANRRILYVQGMPAMVALALVLLA
jgi:putative membrane protein